MEDGGAKSGPDVEARLAVNNCSLFIVHSSLFFTSFTFSTLWLKNPEKFPIYGTAQGIGGV
jgi:hypothetical protein